MAALTANSWTVTILERAIVGNRRKIVAQLALAGTDTYPDNGVPLPTFDKLGFVRNVDTIHVYGVDQTAGTVADYQYRYNKANHKMLMYEEEAAAAGGPLLECDTAEVPGARTLEVEMWGW